MVQAQPPMSYLATPIIWISTDLLCYYDRKKKLIVKNNSNNNKKRKISSNLNFILQYETQQQQALKDTCVCKQEEHLLKTEV